MKFEEQRRYEVYRDERHKPDVVLARDLTYEQAREFEKQAKAELEKEPGYRSWAMSRPLILIRMQKGERGNQ